MDKHPLDGWTMLVCNPVAGSGRGEAWLSVVRRTLDDAGISYAWELTRRRGHAVQLARSAVCSGCSAVVAIGGDGTFFEVVNGIMNPGAVYGHDPAESAGRVAVGLVQAGRGSDFGRSIGVPADVQVAAERLLDGRTEIIDVGYVTYQGFDGKERSRYFANAAGLGFDGEVTLRANAGPRILGGTIPYLSSLVRTLVKYRNKHITVKLEEAEPWSAVANSIVIANGQFFGGGMKIAPDAQLSDGVLNITLLGDLGKIDLLHSLPRVYDGSHVTHPKVRILTARSVEVTSTERVLLQADGEVLGTAPATFRVVPGALRIIV